MLTYLICPRVKNFLKQSLENRNLFLNVRLNRFLYRGGPTRQILANRLFSDNQVI